jgi:uncharacterized protein YegL
MRRLPVFFVIDCSESMVGESIQKVELGLETFVKALRADPYALETVHVSVIAFAGISKVLTPLIDVISFYPPKLPIGDGTNLGKGLETLMNELDSRLTKSTSDQKGDWKPLVYLFTDGRPTEDLSREIARWRESYAKKANLIAVSIGGEADVGVLEQFSSEVLVFEDREENDFKKFIEWISSSVSAQSRSLGVDGISGRVPEMPPAVSLAKGGANNCVDEVCVTLVGRCQKSHKPYLIKYDREKKFLEKPSFSLDISRYHLSGCYPLNEDYFEWSGPSKRTAEVNTDRLDGSPSCPYCGNFTAFAVCECGKLLCASGPGAAVCPWCERELNFASGESSADEGFSVNRGKG